MEIKRRIFNGYNYETQVFNCDAPQAEGEREMLVSNLLKNNLKDAGATQDKIVFIDLDGTLINTLSGETFPKGIWDMKLNFDLLDALKAYNPTAIYIVTNQGGISDGYVNLNSFIAKLKYVERIVEDYCGCNCFSDYCAFNDAAHPMRKPNCGMLKRFCEQDMFSKEDAIMIGDASGKEGQFSDVDKKCAKNFGIDYYDVDDFVNYHLAKDQVASLK